MLGVNRILILLASLVLVAPYQALWADSALENYFPRFAVTNTVLSANHSSGAQFKVILKGDKVILKTLYWQIVLMENVRSLSDARNRSFRVKGAGSNAWVVVAAGKLDRFELNYMGSSNTIVLISRSEYAEYVQARKANVGQAFDTAEWVERQGESRPPNPSPTPDSDRQLLSTGTGFLVNKNFIATADHVLRMNDRGDVCNSVSIMYRHDEYEASIADLDPANDIGLLKLSKPLSSTAKIRNDPDLRLGETAVNYGFPLVGELSSSAKVTGGAVNSLSGYNNNSSFLQYDAASQHGNSGGPVLDASGNVIGVVSAKLDDAETQLVNFATKSTILEGFLKANKVPFEKADLGEKLELPDIAEKAETFTVLVGCWE
jgi:S1-C subfamily serine protease